LTLADDTTTVVVDKSDISTNDNLALEESTETPGEDGSTQSPDRDGSQKVQKNEKPLAK